MPSLKNALAQINKPASWLKKPRDYEGFKSTVIWLVLFALFFPLFALAWIAACDLLSQAVQFDLFSWFVTEGEAPKPESKPNEPSFGFAALIATILGAPFIIWRSWVAHQDYKVSKQGHITDRINKAVENLGAHKTNKDGETIPNLEVRIGGIFALERIAQDSLRDHIQIMEILCAYIRKNSSLDKGEDRKKPSRVDIQIAFTVIGRRRQKQINTERKHNYKLDFTCIDLNVINLEGLNFDYANFSFSNLYRVNFSGASLISIRLQETNLDFVTLCNANMQYATLTSSKISNTIFDKAKIKNAVFNSLVFKRTISFKGLDLKDLKYFEWIAFKGVILEFGYKIDDSLLENLFADGDSIFLEGVNWPKHWPKEKLGSRFDEGYRDWLGKKIGVKKE